MTTVIERVARSIGLVRGHTQAWPEDFLYARAAIEALRDPSAAMASAAAKAAWHSGSGVDPRRICVAVIDAALSDPAP